MKCPRCATIGVAVCVCAFVAATWPKVGEEGELHLPTFSTPVSGVPAINSASTTTILSWTPPDRVIFNTVADGEYDAKPVPQPLFQVQPTPSDDDA